MRYERGRHREDEELMELATVVMHMNLVRAWGGLWRGYFKKFISI